jgi:hypothetical protein
MYQSPALFHPSHLPPCIISRYLAAVPCAVAASPFCQPRVSLFLSLITQRFPVTRHRHQTPDTPEAFRRPLLYPFRPCLPFLDTRLALHACKTGSFVLSIANPSKIIYDCGLNGTSTCCRQTSLASLPCRNPNRRLQPRFQHSIFCHCSHSARIPLQHITSASLAGFHTPFTPGAGSRRTDRAGTTVD